MNRRWLGALAAFLALPGLVAFVVPVVVVAPDGFDSFVNPIGLFPLAPGIGILLWCVREFYVVGRGTLAPWSPPHFLVTSGPYRYSRNPMYIAVALILCGWAVGFRSWVLVLYTLGVTLAFHLRVRFHEEPWLARTFGSEWSQYRARVPRWLPH